VEFSLETMKKIASVADGIGPAYSLVLSKQADGSWQKSEFIARAHEAGLVVHPYTIRADVPMGAVKDPSEMFRLVLEEAGADGVFTDHPDLGVKWKSGR
jgi:glycerophosphoryl diester phosphodiesterase